MTDDTEAIRMPEGPAELIETEFEIGQDNFQTKIGPFGLDIHNPVFMISGLVVIAFVVLTLAFQNEVGPLFDALRKWLTSSLDWFFLIAGNIFVLLCLGLIVSPLGSVRLGGRDAVPDYGYVGWFSMLFAAGMGIGLMFFGVLEPVYHMALSEPLGVPSPFDENGQLIPENVPAAKAMGISDWKIMFSHILPNVMHVALIAAVLSFSGRVLAESVLSYLGIGVGPDTISWGVMINEARQELAREPVVWWKLGAAFIFMLGLVLPANLFGDALRDALDPRLKQ